MATGRVLVGGTVADKPSRLVSPGQPVVLQGPPPRFVSRGGEKLDAALERFGVEVAGRRVLDAGASTGGFTDCFLQRGAAHVWAVDVGYGQLDRRLREDRRVSVLERVNVRGLNPDTAGLGQGPGFEPFDVVTADLSFISLTAVVPVLAGPIVRRGGDLVVLVKPQFEAGRAEVSKGKGVVRDPDVWRRALLKVASALTDARTGIMGAMASPVAGPAGNIEFFLHAVAGADPVDEARVDLLVDGALQAARSGEVG